MALTVKDLTEEQKTKLKSIYKRFIIGNIVASVLYMWSLFFANLAVAMINRFYMHSEQFSFLASVGSAIIILRGLLATIEERREKFAKEASEFLPKTE